MATIQRPVKTYGTRTYVAEVAAAPGNEDPILASEVDSDLDTIYSAWNGGADTVNIKDGAVTYAKLAADAKLWQVSGATLTPVDATKRVVVPGPTTAETTDQASIIFGTRTPKGRLMAIPSGDAFYWMANARNTGTAWVFDDAAKASWLMSLDVQGDKTQWFRGAPGAQPTALMTLDSVGKLTLPGEGTRSTVQLGAATPKARVLTTSAASPYTAWSLNIDTPSGTRDDTAKPAWEALLRLDTDNFEVRRWTAAAVLTTLLTLDSSGILHVAGSASGIRCQNVGSIAANGYSNAVAFGWDGTLKCRVDGTQVGTVTLTSDKRVKLNEREDIPGLDAVCTLRPISFEYDQTKREIGFPRGRHYGLIAQEAQAVVPLVIEEEGEFLSIDYRTLVPVLIHAIQELAARVTALEG